MADGILVCFSCLLCGGAFFLMGYLCRVSSAPVQFWTGSEKKLKQTVRDYSGYNRKMGKAFHWYGAAWCACALAGFFLPIAAVLGALLCCTLGLFLLHRRYRKVLSEFA